MQSNQSRVLAALVIGALSAIACGGSSFVDGSGDAGRDAGGDGGGSGSGSGSSSGSGSGSSSGSSGGGSGSSSGGTPTACPATLPGAGGACARVGLVCEYGSDPDPGCNQLETCETNGWSKPAAGRCVTGVCPAHYGDVPVGKDCTAPGLDCAYLEGQCDCAGTAPVSGPTPVWQCATPQPGCPEPRPRLGSACSRPGLSCDYGACTGGVDVQCSDGVWKEEPTICPAIAL